MTWNANQLDVPTLCAHSSSIDLLKSHHVSSFAFLKGAIGFYFTNIFCGYILAIEKNQTHVEWYAQMHFLFNVLVPKYTNSIFFGLESVMNLVKAYSFFDTSICSLANFA